MLTCPSCGRESPEDFAFCPACAAPLASPAAREIRKTVTVVFCDVTGSTAMGEKLDPESLRRVMSRYFSEMRVALERHGGTVEKFIGDAVMAVFGVPQIHEDDALRAVRAAADMREGVRLLSKEVERDHGVALQARIGVNTGEVVAGDGVGGTLVTGDTVNVAARLEQAAAPGDVMIGAQTHRLVRDAVVAEPVEPLDVKGKSKPIHAFRLGEVTTGAPGVARRLDSPVVGRARQLAQLKQAFDASAADRSCQLFTVLGPPGVGKSRLVHELVSTIEDVATVLRGRCLPYGDGITFFPVAEVLKEAADLEDFDDTEEIERKICAVLGEGDEGPACSTLAQLFGAVDHEGSTEETLWAVRHFLESVAQAAPLVVVFDDIHWGEATFLELIEHVTDWSRDAPILVLCMARPELLDLRPSWGGGKLNAATISLEPLSDDESDALIANLLGHAALPDEARLRILEAAEGTPLFVEQMLSMLIDDGLLVLESEGWIATGDLSGVPVPSSVQALIAARLDRLSPDERAAIERAAVVGKQFHMGAVAALSNDGSGVRAALMGLVRRDMVGPDRSLLAGDDAFRFRHLLIRDAAYEAIPKAVRAEHHERFADWLLDVAGDRIEEQEEILGYHLEQAYRSRTELGPPDAAVVELGTSAASHLLASARRASERGDPGAAANLYRRAADLLPAEHPDRPRALYDAALEMEPVGEMRVALELAEEAIGAAEEADQQALAWRARIARSSFQMLVDPHAISTDQVRDELREAIAQFEEISDDVGLATAWRLLAETRWMSCRFDRAREELGRAVDHARRAGDRRLIQHAYALWLTTDAFGSTTPAAGIERLDAALHELGSEGFVGEHLGFVQRGIFLAMLGDLDEGRRLIDMAVANGRRVGAGFWIGAALEWRVYVEEFGGDPAEAELAARECYRIESELGDEGHASTAAGNLARALSRLGRFDEVERYAAEALRAPAEDVASQAGGRSAMALVLSAAGGHDEAISLAREAVDVLAHAQAPHFQGITWSDLAEVLRAAGRIDASRSAAKEALGLHERKGNLPAAEAARTFLKSLEPA